MPSYTAVQYHATWDKMINEYSMEQINGRYDA